MPGTDALGRQYAGVFGLDGVQGRQADAAVGEQMTHQAFERFCVAHARVLEATSHSLQRVVDRLLADAPQVGNLGIGQQRNRASPQPAEGKGGFA